MWLVPLLISAFLLQILPFQETLLKIQTCFLKFSVAKEWLFYYSLGRIMRGCNKLYACLGKLF